MLILISSYVVGVGRRQKGYTAIHAVVPDRALLEDWDNALDSHPRVPEQFTEFRDLLPDQSTRS